MWVRDPQGSTNFRAGAEPPSRDAVMGRPKPAGSRPRRCSRRSAAAAGITRKRSRTASRHGIANAADSTWTNGPVPSRLKGRNVIVPALLVSERVFVISERFARYGRPARMTDRTLTDSLPVIGVATGVEYRRPAIRHACIRAADQSDRSRMRPANTGLRSRQPSRWRRISSRATFASRVRTTSNVPLR